MRRNQNNTNHKTNRCISLVDLNKEEKVECSNALNERKGCKDADKETDVIKKRQKHHTKKIIKMHKVEKMDVASINTIIEDYVLKDQIKSNKIGIDSNKSDISFTSAQEDYYNFMKEHVVFKIKQYKEECNGTHKEEEESIKEDEDKHDNSVDTADNSFRNEKEDEDNDSVTLGMCWDKMEETQKN